MTSMHEQSRVATAAAALAEPTIRAAVDADADRWQQYVYAHPASTLYHRWEWRDVLQRTLGHRSRYLIATRGERIVGVLPLAEVKTMLFGHSLSSLPMASDAGPLVDDAQVLAALDAQASALAHSLGVDYLEYRALQPVADNRPVQDLYVLFRKAITADHDANLNAVPRKQRAMVRKGLKNALQSQHGDLNTFFDLYADNVHRHGTPPFSKRYFQALQRAFGADCDVLVVHGPSGEPLSGVISLFFRDEVFPIYAGDVPAARALAANDLKYWELMRFAADRGCRWFNYGRSKKGTGQFDFKTHWGFEPTQLAYTYDLVRAQQMPQNNPTNPRYQMLIATWRRLPRWVVNGVGPHLVRGLG